MRTDVLQAYTYITEKVLHTAHNEHALLYLVYLNNLLYNL